MPREQKAAGPGGASAAWTTGELDGRVAPAAPQRGLNGGTRRRRRLPQCTRNPRTARRLLAVVLEEVLKRGLLDREQVTDPSSAEVNS